MTKDEAIKAAWDFRQPKGRIKRFFRSFSTEPFHERMWFEAGWRDGAEWAREDEKIQAFVDAETSEE